MNTKLWREGAGYLLKEARANPFTALAGYLGELEKIAEMQPLSPPPDMAQPTDPNTPQTPNVMSGPPERPVISAQLALSKGLVRPGDPRIFGPTPQGPVMDAPQTPGAIQGGPPQAPLAVAPVVQPNPQSQRPM